MSGYIDVVRPGMLTTVQDAGRFGWQAHGVSASGPMDPFAFRMANALVGNDRRAAALEVTLVGPSLTFSDARLVAVSGALFDLSVDGAAVVSTHAFVVPAGATLKFGDRRRGARAYVAVAGGVDVPLLLASRATHLPSRLGGHQGRALVKGDRLPLGQARIAPSLHTHPLNAAVRTPADQRVRVMAGPDLEPFDPETLTLLQREPYVVDANSDRTGFRLTGSILARRTIDDQRSDVTTMGTIQVPADGQPIVLMADRQTTGGYPRVATVIAADIGVVGQAAPGDAVRFEVCSREAAREALRAVERPLMAIEVAS